jgi:TonB-linked SusC/RagA family outer membrane protein
MAPPTVQPRNPDGTWAGGNGGEDGFNEPNPLYDINVPETVNTRFRSIASVFAEYEVIPGLSIKANMGMDFVMQNIRIWNPSIPSSGGRPISITGLQQQINFSPSYLAEYTANYKKSFGDHNMTLLGGYTVQDNQFNVLGAGRNGYQRLDMQVLDDAATVPANVSQTFNFGANGTNRLLSIVSRANYDFKGKYLFSFSLRRDGSSNFGPGYKYAVFPAASAAWNIIDEDFMKSVDFISNLKLRLSFGQTGNQNVPAFAYLQRINTGIQYPLGDNSGSGGANSAAAPTSTKNPELRWEKNEQANIGIDLAVLANRFSVSADFYRRASRDLIFSVAPPSTSGTYEFSPLNTGTMVNTGIDLSFNTVNLPASSPIKWTSTLIYSAYKNNIESLGQSAPIIGSFPRITGGGLKVDEGLPVNYFFGYVADGIFQNWDEVRAHAVQTPGTDGSNGTAPGDIRFKDLNGDGIINDKDRTNLGNSIPTFTYGFTNNLSWKSIELSVFLQGSSGNKVLNFTRWYTEGGVSNGNYSKEVLNRWTGPGTSNSMPRMIQADPNQNNRVSSRFVEDASYLRVKNIRLSWNLPNNWAIRAGVANLKVYGSVQNALTFTKYTGFDPEVGGGVDFGFYPQARTWLGGLTMEF